MAKWRVGGGGGVHCHKPVLVYVCSAAGPKMFLVGEKSGEVASRGKVKMGGGGGRRWPNAITWQSSHCAPVHGVERFTGSVGVPPFLSHPGELFNLLGVYCG